MTPEGFQRKLTTLKNETLANKSPELVATLLHEIEDLAQSGITEKAIKPGEILPEFMLPDAKGDIVSSKNLLSKGALVISFYRGIW